MSAGEENKRAIQETDYLMSIPGMAESICEARNEGIEAGTQELGW